MTDRDALYAAVLAVPDDDTPRLVYADYLDDTGVRADTIRARFIRNQVALARAEPGSDEYDRLYRATAPVEDHYRKEWAGENDAITYARFVRGFVGEVTGYSKRFVADGAAIFAKYPVRAVRFAAMNSTRGAATPQELAACPHLARLTGVFLHGAAVTEDFLAAVGASPHAAGIRRLGVQLTKLGKSLLNRLGSSAFPGLRELDLDAVDMGDDGAALLAKSKHLAGLEILSFSRGMDRAGTPLRGPGAVALAESKHLRGLKQLDVRGQELRKKGFEAFAAAYAWPGMRYLGLRGNGIPASALLAFVANPHLRSLNFIDFRSNDIKAEHLGPLREACPNTRILTDDTDDPIRVTLLAEDRP